LTLLKKQNLYLYLGKDNSGEDEKFRDRSAGQKLVLTALEGVT